MVNKRTEICRNCPICDLTNWICNASLYLNPKTNEVSKNPKMGFVKGCGCALSFKIKNPDKKCPAGKW